MAVSKKAEMKRELEKKLGRHFGKTLKTALPQEMYKACALIIKDDIMEKWVKTRTKFADEKPKEVYYLSFEFLIGKAFINNLINIGKYDLMEEILQDYGYSLNDIEGWEPEPGLGNGGLGRLAACYIDSLSTLELPAVGCGIRYEYGLFKQKIVEGYQVEVPDSWLQDGNVWEVPRPEDSVPVEFGGRVEAFDDNDRTNYRTVDTVKVIAVPYDMPVVGYNTDSANSLRLWSAKSAEEINMAEFSSGHYASAMEQKEMAEVLSKVLYPEDNHIEGKKLRLKQQYFFVSATLQWILKREKARGVNLYDLPDHVQLHINDTHPAIAIPELMRLLMDNEGMGWDEAYSICTRVFAYTNHTVMAEALEKWPCHIVQELLPRVYMIIEELNRRNDEILYGKFIDDYAKIDYMKIVSNNNISMANLCLAVCHSVNGVSQLHTDILINDLFKDYYILYPEKFKNVTNGITFRRWLAKANPGLADLITSRIGEDWLVDGTQLSKLLDNDLHNDADFVERFSEIRLENKKKLAAYIKEHNGVDVDVNSIFDVQAKRLHEYKRQLLNVLHIMYLYNEIKDNPNIDMQPRTFIFAAKASPGYRRAKQVIKLINSVADVVNNDPIVQDRIKVVFLENYSVSLAEKIIVAADVSEQISTAGKEASGTGNMKFMLNGALTVGTLDGANVEMSERVGDENIFIFGLRSHEVQNIYRTGNTISPDVYQNNPKINRIVNQLTDGTFGSFSSQQFSEIFNGLVVGEYGFVDNYMVLADINDYIVTQQKIADLYKNDKKAWWKKAVINTAEAGYFLSDRCIAEYNEKIWKLR